MKFSIIIPVYNVEKYIKRCLESLINQTYKDYEIIIVNDGSKDNSQEIIDSYKGKIENCKVYVKENGGLSDARNYGINFATGDYLFFLDSDDYIDMNLLEMVRKNIEDGNEPDVIRIPKKTVNENGEILEQDNVNVFMNYSGSEAYISIRKNKITLETAWAYFFKRSFWMQNDYKFAKGKIHEDLGLIPLVILSAEKISAINTSFYNYVKRDNSIITTKSYEKDVKKAWDILFHYDYLLRELNKLITEKNILQEAQYLYKYYISDAVFNKLKTLKGQERKKYKEEVKKRNVIGNITDHSLKSTIKKLYYSYLLLK